MNKEAKNVHARQLNINVGDQKTLSQSKTVLIGAQTYMVVTHLVGVTFMPEVMLASLLPGLQDKVHSGMSLNIS